MREELREMEEALLCGNPVDRWAGIADALCDNLVFFHHLVCKLGLAPAMFDMFAEVDSSNHTKGEGNVLFDEKTGKMIKGAGFRKANIHKFFVNNLAATSECASPVDYADEARRAQRLLVNTFLAEDDDWKLEANLVDLNSSLLMSGEHVWFRARNLHGKFTVMNERDERIGTLTFDIPHCAGYSEREVILTGDAALVRPSSCLG